MKVYPSEKIRNVGFVAHQGAGKTSLIEALVFNTGTIKRLGRVDDGNTVADYMPEEIKRKSTISAALVAAEWRDTKLNIFDTPGFADFFSEVVGVGSVVDSFLMVLDAVAGTEVSTEIIWDFADEKNLPIIAYMNKMDRENANFTKAVDSMKATLTRQIVPVQLPIGQAADFSGIIDLIEMKAYKYDDGKATIIDIPKELLADAELAREELIEAAAEGEDDITMKYLDGEELTQEEIILGLKAGVAQGNVVPVLCGSADKNIAVDKLADILVDFAPCPLANMDDSLINKPTTAVVFKTLADPYVGKISFFKVMQGNMKGDTTMYNANKEFDEKVAHLNTMQGKNMIQLPEINFGDIGVVAKLNKTVTSDWLTVKGNSDLSLDKIVFPAANYRVAISPKTKGDEDKLGSAINRILEEEPTLTFEKDAVTNQTTLTGTGETHLNIIIDRLKSKFGVEVEIVEMKIPYRETIRGSAQKVEGKHKKQSGGHGQYGHVFIDIEPYADGDFAFEEKIFGGSVPKNYIPAVEKGMREAMREGILAGYPVSNIKITLIDGSYHDVDSSEMAFKLAASMAFKKACEQAKPVLLEPVMDVEISVPDQFMGDIMGDMNTKRGRILGMEKSGKMQKIKAQAPLSEMLRYAIDLRSITQGRGRFDMDFSHYEEVPKEIADKVIAQTNAEKE
jgi:elongation factor G